MSLNKVTIIGNLSKDVELSETQTGIKVARFSVAVGRKFERDVTDFFNIVAWRGLAENCANYLKKGNKCAIVGTLQNRSYEANDGTKRYVTEIIADEVEFLSTKQSQEQKEESPELEPITDDSLPF